MSRHDCHPFSVYGAEVGIFDETNHICFCSFLQPYDGAPLEALVIFAHFKGYLID